MRTDFPSCFALEASAGRSLSCGMSELEPEKSVVDTLVGGVLFVGVWCAKVRKRCGNLELKNVHGDPRGRIEGLRFARPSRTSDRTRCLPVVQKSGRIKAAYGFGLLGTYLDLWALCGCCRIFPWVYVCLPCFSPQSQLSRHKIKGYNE